MKIVYHQIDLILIVKHWKRPLYELARFELIHVFAKKKTSFKKSKNSNFSLFIWTTCICTSDEGQNEDSHLNK